MSQQHPLDAWGRDPTYGERLDRIARETEDPQQAVLVLERLRAYRIARRCRWLSHEDAEDLVQEYSLRIVQVWSRWDQERPLLPFLNKLLFRELANHGRRSAKSSLRNHLKFGELPEEGVSCLGVDGDPRSIDTEPGEIAIRREYLSLVKCDINRAILELSIEGANEDEIVEVLGLPNHQRVWNGRARGIQNIRDQTKAE